MSDAIWVADVGQDSHEEVSIFKKGDNGQWPFREGYGLHLDKPETVYGNEKFPILQYPRGEGRAVVGGLIYQGDNYPELKGKYIFGDYVSGNVWSYDSLAEEKMELLTTGVQSLVGFFINPEGDICMMTLLGEFLTLKKSISLIDAPLLLSETGAFDDLINLTPSCGVVRYEINTPLWSDGATKDRWISVPYENKINYSKNEQWVFKPGTVLIKHFEMDLGNDSTKRLETRFFVMSDDSKGYGLTYRWDENDTDATLVGPTESLADTFVLEGDNRVIWNYPTRSECIQCHNESAGFILGIKTAQINKSVCFDNIDCKNQVEYWSELELFDEVPDTSNMPKMYNIEDTLVNKEVRVRSYLDANCSHCHNPMGVAPQFDGRFSTELKDQGIIFHPTLASNSLDDNLILTPEDTAKSEIWRRDASLTNIKMPPLSKNRLDSSYLNLLKNWIYSLSPSTVNLNDTICQGDEYITLDSLIIVADSSFTDVLVLTSKIGLDSTIMKNVSVIPKNESPCLTLKLSDKFSDFQVYPTLVTDNNLFISSSKDIKQIALINMSGESEIIIPNRTNEFEYGINISNSGHPGIYLLLIYSAGEVYKTKIIVVK